MICCKTMAKALMDTTITVDTRDDKPVYRIGRSAYQILSCPFCGTRIPETFITVPLCERGDVFKRIFAQMAKDTGSDCPCEQMSRRPEEYHQTVENSAVCGRGERQR